MEKHGGAMAGDEILYAACNSVNILMELRSFGHLPTGERKLFVLGWERMEMRAPCGNDRSWSLLQTFRLPSSPLLLCCCLRRSHCSSCFAAFCPNRRQPLAGKKDFTSRKTAQADTLSEPNFGGSDKLAHSSEQQRTEKNLPKQTSVTNSR